MIVYCAFKKEIVAENIEKICDFYGIYFNKENAEEMCNEQKIKFIKFNKKLIQRMEPEIAKDFKKQMQKKYSFKVQRFGE